MTRLVAFWLSHQAELVSLLERHLLLVLLSTFVAVAIGLPVGILAAHRPRIGRPIVALASIAQTIPSLALLGFLLPLPFIGGIGPRIAIVALIVYALLPIVRTTAAGLKSIDRSVIDAGVAMGMTGRQLLWIVELPLALPSIVAGIRVAVVTGIGTATIAAAVGAGGLGEYIFRGLSMVDPVVILAGAVPAAAMAVIADALLTWIERRLAPGGSAKSVWRPMLVTAAIVGSLFIIGRAWSAENSNAVVIGSKNFTEQVILGELLAQTLEARGLPVVRRLNLGGTFICDQAIRSGDIDAYVEYTGTALTAIFHEKLAGSAPDSVLARVQELAARAGLSVLPSLGFNNTFAILVRKRDATEFGLRSIADLQATQNRWIPGFGYEFVEREDGYRGLAAAYGLRFTREPRVMDLSLMYRALASGEVDVVAGDATSALIDALDLHMLNDDRNYFPPYHAVPVVRTATLLAQPAIGDAIRALAGKISESDMRAMNHAVDVSRRDVADVAGEFLRRLQLNE